MLKNTSQTAFLFAKIPQSCLQAMEIAIGEASDPSTKEHLPTAHREEPLRLSLDTRNTKPSNAWAMTEGVPYCLPHVVCLLLQPKCQGRLVYSALTPCRKAMLLP